jgi:hypothetical protein
MSASISLSAGSLLSFASSRTPRSLEDFGKLGRI